MQIITPSQCRAARALLNWSQPDLAAKCDMHIQTISLFENETSTPTKTTLEKIVGAFEEAGIELLSQDGVRKTAGSVRTYYGNAGYNDFMVDVYATVAKMKGDVCVSNVREHDFDKATGFNTSDPHVAKMTALKKASGFNFRILVQEGDTYFPAKNYAEYRWIESKYFKTVPFYVYGDKLAFLIFGNEPVIHVVESKDIADAQRVQFNVFWENAKIPPKV